MNSKFNSTEAGMKMNDNACYSINETRYDRNRFISPALLRNFFCEIKLNERASAEISAAFGKAQSFVIGCVAHRKGSRRCLPAFLSPVSCFRGVQLLSSINLPFYLQCSPAFQ